MSGPFSVLGMLFTLVHEVVFEPVFDTFLYSIIKLSPSGELLRKQICILVVVYHFKN